MLSLGQGITMDNTITRGLTSWISTAVVVRYFYENPRSMNMYTILFASTFPVLSNTIIPYYTDTILVMQHPVALLYGPIMILFTYMLTLMFDDCFSKCNIAKDAEDTEDAEDGAEAEGEGEGEEYEEAEEEEEEEEEEYEEEEEEEEEYEEDSDVVEDAEFEETDEDIDVAEDAEFEATDEDTDVAEDAEFEATDEDTDVAEDTEEAEEAEEAEEGEVMEDDQTPVVLENTCFIKNESDESELISNSLLVTPIAPIVNTRTSIDNTDGYYTSPPIPMEIDEGNNVPDILTISDRILHDMLAKQKANRSNISSLLREFGM